MELLIKAKEPWNNNIDTSGMTEEELRTHNQRTRLGDIIVLRPDGWEWGREECLPHFIVVKIPGVNPPSNYEEPLTQIINDDRVTLKTRKFQVPPTYVNKAVRDGTSVIEITLSQKKIDFINSIIEKMS